MRCAEMRTLLPARRTLPSRSAPTLSLCAMSATESFLPLKENEALRAATRMPFKREKESRISSDSPSEKYSCEASPLKLANGMTARECPGALNAGGAEIFAASTDREGSSRSQKPTPRSLSRRRHGLQYR